MKTYKKSYLKDKKSLMFTAWSVISSLILSVFIFVMLSFDKNTEGVALLLIFFVLLTTGIAVWYGDNEDIRLRSPQPGETIKILFTKKVSEFDSWWNEYEKVFYLYSVDEVIYSDEREPTLLELGKKYFVNKDGGLELKE